MEKSYKEVYQKSNSSIQIQCLFNFMTGKYLMAGLSDCTIFLATPFTDQLLVLPLATVIF